MSPSPGSVIAGKFRLERPLAQGGMGSVWVAHNLQLDVPVAVKFMAQALAGSAELVARFEREAKAAAQLRHPNVVQVFEHGVAGGLPYMAMELLEGESLGHRLKVRRTLSIGETSRILGDVCLALRRAHERGLVHRDLKPANIFLCRCDELETVKVLDFGIVKSISSSAEEEITKSGAIFGSPHYMSPEQARRTNRPVDHRTDLWALGVIAFRCLTGALPFPGDDTIDVLVRLCTDAPPRPSSIAPALGPEVDSFFLRALARDPDERFQSARQLADALAALAAHPAGDARQSRASIPEIESWSRPAPRPVAPQQGPFAAQPHTPVPRAPFTATPQPPSAALPHTPESAHQAPFAGQASALPPPRQPTFTAQPQSPLARPPHGAEQQAPFVPSGHPPFTPHTSASPQQQASFAARPQPHSPRPPLAGAGTAAPLGAPAAVGESAPDVTTTLPFAPEARQPAGSAEPSQGVAGAPGSSPFVPAGQATSASGFSATPALTHVESTTAGTLTAAGTDVRSGGPTGRSRGWVIPAAIGAALVLGLTSLAIGLSGGGGAGTSPPGEAANSAGSRAPDKPMPLTTSIPIVAPALQPTVTEPFLGADATPEPAAAERPGSVPGKDADRDPAANGSPAASSATTKGAAATSRVTSTPGTSGVAAPATGKPQAASTPSTAAPAASGPGPAGGSGYLTKPKF